MQNKCIRFFLKLDKMYHKCNALRDFVSDITLRLYDLSNASKCMLKLFSTSLLFLFVFFELSWSSSESIKSKNKMG